MASAKLHHLLLGRAFRSRFQLVETTPINRRQFLTRTTTVGAAALSFGIDPLTPHLVRKGNALLVLYRARVWRIDPALFGAAARVGWRKEDRDFIIDLTQARLPGTDLDVSFRARLRSGLSGWRIRLTIPGQAFDAAAPLGDWIADEAELTGRVSTRRITIGESSAALAHRPRLTVNPSFGFRFSGTEDCVRFDRPFACEGTGLTLDLAKPAAATLLEATLGVKLPATHFAIRDVRVNAGAIPLDHGVGVPPASCCADAAIAVTGESFTRGTLDEALFVLEGPMRVFGHGPAPSADAPSQVRLEHAALMAASGRERCEWALAGRVSRIAHAMEVAGCQFLVAGDDERPFYLRQSDRGGPIRLQARLERAWIPLAGADSASLSAGNDVVDIVLHDRQRQPEAEYDQPRPGLILLGEQPSAVLPLGSSRLTIRRGLDLVNLTFAFQGFDLRVKDGTPWLIRHKPVGKNQPWPDGTVSVTFPPQHVAEQYTLVTDPYACMDMSAFPDVSKARLSAPSRVVFKLCTDARKPQWTEQPLSIEQLTDWSELALQVHDRALEPDASFEKQLKLSGITADTKLSDLPSGLASQLQPPAADKTALTMSGRLVLSPSESARFTTPRVAPNPAAAPLWHARLNVAGRKTVRAIWSYYLTPGAFTAPDEDGDHMLPISAIHHWDIVAQTSLYLLPARRRGLAVKDPVKDEKDRPRSRVIRPDATFESLRGLDNGSANQESGFAIPQPFDDADILLTSMGGSFVANWHGEPPSLLYLPDHLPKVVGFSLERLEYWSQLGRDIRVESVDKGYMLPLGIRCSHIELVERRFFRHPARREPVAYLIQRQFIVFGKPEKNYPGEGQPFAARDFPPRKVAMLTRKTPDLLPPETGLPHPVAGSPAQVRDGGRVEFPDEPFAFKIFWPRTKPRPGVTGDVDFKWAADDTLSPITSNLLFVENRAVSIDRVIKKVVAYYRSLAGDLSALRTAQLSGARRQYAPSGTEGDTSFDTSTWLLSASGRITVGSNNDESEEFRMDAAMEGADQPPFYPYVEQTFINVQSLDRLLGKPQGLICAAYTPEYVRHGFHTTLNPSEIYLNVLSPEIALDVTSQGNTTGGVAKPNALVVAMSRKSGPVGGSRGKTAAGPLPDPGAGDQRRQVGGQGSFDFTQALSGRFDPAEFFGGLGSAKLLGLIPLKDVLSVVGFDQAPKLLEDLGYGVDKATGEALQFVKDVFRQPIVGDKNLAALVNEAVTAVQAPVGGVRFQDLYPTLHQRLVTFNTTLQGSTTKILGASTIADIGGPLTDIVRDGRALLDEVERTLKYPLPAIAQTALDTLNQLWTNLKTLLNGQYLDLARRLQEQVVHAALVDVCQQVTDAHLGGVLFGLDDTLTCEEVVDNPADALKRVEASLFSEFFSGPLVRMLSAIRGFEAEADARIAWQRAEFTRLVSVAIAEVAESVKDRLRTVISDADQKLFVDALVRKYADAIRAVIVPPPSVHGALAPLANPADEIDKQLARVLQAVERLSRQLTSGELARDAAQDVVKANPAILQPRNSSDAAALLSEFATNLTGRVRTAADATIGTEVRALRDVLLTQIQQARGQAIERVLRVTDQAFAAMVGSIDFARITAAARAIKTWCQGAANNVPAVFRAAEAIVIGLMGDVTRIEENVKALGDAAVALPVQVTPQLDRARASLLASIQQLSDLLRDLKKRRDEFDAIKQRVIAGTLDVCTAPGEWLRPAEAILSASRQSIERLADVLDKMTAVQQALPGGSSGPALLVASVPLDGPADPWPALLDNVRQLLQQLTSLGEVALPGVWTSLKDTIETSLVAGADPQTLGAYVDRLRGELQAIESRALAINQALSLATGPAQLRALAADVLTYTVEHDKRLAALVLQTVAFTQALQQRLEQRATEILKGIATPVHDIHAGALSLLDTLIAALETPPADLLLNPAITAALKTARQELNDERGLLQQIKDASNADAVVAAARSLRERWETAPRKPPALVRVLAMVADLAESVLKGDLKTIVNQAAIRQRLEELAQHIRGAIAEMIPTRVHLSYAWQTSVGSFPSSDPIFAMTESAPDDLQLTADIVVDLVTRTRTALVRGAMRPFKVKLLGSAFDIATISFRGASFESRDGSAPAFDAQVSDVELGQLVQFIKPLQQWLSPGDNGFYVKPVLNPPAIEAGYRFYTEVIPLGAILFVNVGLSVAARLPFSDTPATFTFSFASPERPFMIVAPPYGGGGYVSVVANPSGIIEFRLSFVFGAVVPIKFGPLSAQGRVVAGIYAIQRSNGQRTIGALIEAAGEGHIACFSISVCLRVGLEQFVESDGKSRLSGWAEFSFEFSIGFASITFKFRATYTAHNDTSSPVGTSGFNASVPVAIVASLNAADAFAAAADCVCKKGDSFARTYRVNTPRKAIEWQQYRERIAMDLI